MQRRALTAAAAAGLLLSLTGARADTAVLVGVDKYVNIGEGRHLGGCANDVKHMEAALRAQGFDRIVRLTDAAATRDAILDAIRAASTEQGRFVFYFSGYGDRTGRKAQLLPADALPKSPGRDIDRDTLWKAVSDGAAKHKTIVLDTSFSDCMSRDVPDTRRIRSFDRISDDRDIEDRASNQDSDERVNGGKGVCYLTGAQGNQQANECEFDGEQQGVFTHFLSEHLKRGRQTGKALCTLVSTDMMVKLQQLQTFQVPAITAAYADEPIFGEAGAGSAGAAVEPAPAPRRTFWEEFNTSNIDRRKLELKMTPDVPVIPVTTDMASRHEFGFTMRAGISGYLILLEQGPSGRLRLQWPRSKSADEAGVQAGDTKAIQKKVAVAPGTERLRAILTTSRAKVEALLSKFVIEPGNKIYLKDSRDIEDEVDPVADTFYTADLTFEVRK